jgi:hypothetical protein
MIADVAKWNRVGTSTAALGLNPPGSLVQFLGNVFDGQEGLVGLIDRRQAAHAAAFLPTLLWTGFRLAMKGLDFDKWTGGNTKEKYFVMIFSGLACVGGDAVADIGTLPDIYDDFVALAEKIHARKKRGVVNSQTRDFEMLTGARPITARLTSFLLCTTTFGSGNAVPL